MREDTSDTQTTDDDASARRQALQDQLNAGAPPVDPGLPAEPTQGVTDPGIRSGDTPATGAPDPGPLPTQTPAYNTTPLWQDPNTPPNPGDPYYAEWAKANQGNPLASAPAVGSQLDASGKPVVTPAAATPPTGGSLTDPAYAAKLVAYWGNQPGVNPSVKNDPNYWIGRFTSGAFQNDQAYAIQRMMTPEGAPEGAGPAAGAATKVTGTGSTVTAPGSAGTAYAMDPTGFPGHPSTDQFGQDIRAQLMALLNQAPVDENDPDIAGAISANKVAQERSLDQERDQIAEAAYAQHLGGAGSTSASMQAARERTGASEGQFSGNLVAQQATARRNQITQLLQTGAGVMTADEQRNLQAEIARLDAILRQQSITNQNNQANDRLGFDVGSFQANMNRNAVLDAMGVHL